MAVITDKFFELIQISLGNKNGFEQPPSESEWGMLFQLSCKHSLAGILFEGFKKTKTKVQGKAQTLFFEWYALQLQTIAANKHQCERAKELSVLLTNDGYRNCVLKGQGTALYYDSPELRQCGDIDIWVEGDRDDILSYARNHGYKIPHIDIKHSDIEFFEDVPVEVHFLPSWMYNPATNKRLQQLFDEQAEKQFENYDVKAGFTHTTIEFDLVFSIVHIYRHIFSEGIGLRQLMDYYYILKSSSANQREDAFAVLRSLKMAKFVGGIMWILRECFGMNKEFLLCPVNVKHGEFLLSEILTAGNFGHYDDRMKRIDHNKRFAHGIVQFKKNLRFVSYYPSEVLWSPLWKLWHWGWRKRKGYL